jgi:hypothetical protein
MKTRKGLLLAITLLLVFGLLLAACDSADGEDDDGDAAEGTQAMVDSVTVEEQMGHKYAVVNGNYPDACTRISDVDQDVDGSTFTINLMTDKPEDLMCAQMLSSFSVSILLEVGGVAPGEYTVTVNDSATTTFTVGG